MERTRGYEKRPKQAKAAKKKPQPVKVVYISNPMKVKASAAEFRALVQELTGQDSDIADLSKFPAAYDEGGGGGGGGDPLAGPSAVATDRGLDPGGGTPAAGPPSEMLDGEPFTPQMLEGFPAFSPPSPSLYYRPQGRGFQS